MLAGSGDALLLGAGKQPQKVRHIMKTKASSESVRFTTIKEANLGIRDAYSKAESFLQSLFIVTCYRMPWESFTGFGFYEGSDPPDGFKLFQSIRKKKADELQEALHQLQFAYQQTTQAFVPLLPMLEIALPKIGLFRNAVHARFFFEAMKIRAEDWGRQFLKVFEGDFIFPITTPSGILSDEEISKRNQQREIENREWGRLRDTIDRLNEELPFTEEDEMDFRNRLRIEKGQLLRDLLQSTLDQVHRKPQKRKTTTPRDETIAKEKDLLFLLEQYEKWQDKMRRKAGKKLKLNPSDWYECFADWTKKTQDLFDKYSSEYQTGSESDKEAAQALIRYAQKRRRLKNKREQENN